MIEHVTAEELSDLLHGNLPQRRVLALAEHLRRCTACSTAARRSEPAARASEELVAQFTAIHDEHPPVETVLTEYVDGTLPRADAAAVDEHLQRCARCREDVGDLRATARAMTPRPRRSWLPVAVAAAMLMVLLAALLVIRRATPEPPLVVQTATIPPATATTPVPPREKYERAEWRAAVDDALRMGALQMPATLAELQLAPDVLRAGSAEESGRLAPVRTIVETTRPRFRWSAVDGAAYVVSVFDGENVVAQSGLLNESRWTPTQDLPRGRVYQWEVEVRRGDDVSTVPAPPAPPALFRVLDDSAYAELRNARALHDDDALLLGVLYARYGLREEAERELRRVPTEEGRRLLHSIQQWSH